MEHEARANWSNSKNIIDIIKENDSYCVKENINQNLFKFDNKYFNKIKEINIKWNNSVQFLQVSQFSEGEKKIVALFAILILKSQYYHGVSKKNNKKVYFLAFSLHLISLS